MSNTESKLISAVLKDKQAHVLLQANIDSILRTHGDIWTFIRKYFEVNGSTPPVSLVVEKFRDFIPTEDIGATKHHLEELRSEYLTDSLKDIIRSAASEVQSGNGPDALDSLITFIYLSYKDKEFKSTFLLEERSIKSVKFTGVLKS